MILYLGLDPSRFPYPVVHYPIIRLEPLPLTTVPPHSHLLFTSPSAVKLFPQIDCPTVLSIGQATSAVLKERGIDSLTAPFATQEGVIELIKTLRIDFLLWPRSSRARTLLENYLRSETIPHQALDLYRTVTLVPDNILDWRLFTQIVFTSPSTVDAFLEIYDSLPPSEKIIAIGPITEAYLEGRS